MEPANGSSKKKVLGGLQWALTVATVGAIGIYLAPNFGDIVAASQLTWQLTMLIVVGLLIQFAANGIVLKLLVQAFSSPFSMNEAILLGLTDSTLNLLPMKAGTVATGVVLARRHGIHVGDFAAIVAGSTILNTWICAFVAGIGLTLIGSQASLGLMIALVPTALVVLLAIWGTLHKPARPTKATSRIRKGFGRAVAGVALIFKNPGLVMGLSAANLIRLAAVALQLHAAFAAISYPVGVIEALTIGSLAVVLGRLSIIPGGLGFKEAGIAATATVVGIPIEFGLAAAVLDRGLMLLALLAIGLPATAYVFRHTHSISGETESDKSGSLPRRVVPVGNAYDKYGTGNPIARYLMRTFRRDLDLLWEAAASDSQLDIGCGEGVLTYEWAKSRTDARFVGLDLEDPALRREWESRESPNLEYICGDAQALSYRDNEFDLVSAIEVLEHLPDPKAAMRDMARIARKHVLLSVPREPIWSILNLARGAYWSSLGNTPGHIQRWSRRSFLQLASELGEVEAVRSPLPWTIVLIRVADNENRSTP